MYLIFLTKNTYFSRGLMKITTQIHMKGIADF